VILKNPTMKPTIRFATIADAPGILEIYAPFVFTPVTFEETVPDVDEIASRIEAVSAKLPYLVCEIGSKTAGYAYAYDFRTRSAYRWIKELSVYVHPGFRRRNIATALYTCLIELLKCQGMTSVLACITVPNPESVNFHENFGFRKVGEFRANGYKLGQWHDVGWWELDLNPGRLDPCREPLPVHELPFPVRDEIFRNGEQMIFL
jgi:L-amino acid N-acyltransferase YncA